MSSPTRRRSIAGASLRLREEGDAPKLGGYAAVFGSWTVLYKSKWHEVRERILPGAFSNALAAGQDVRALVDHNPTLILGRTKSGTLTLRQDDRGLAVEILPPSTEFARGVMESVRRGDVDQMSFAFIPRKGGEVVTTRQEDGLEITEIEISDVDLYDVSLVTYPAYPDTAIGVRQRSPDVADRIRRSKEAWLAGARAKSDEAARRLASSPTPPLTKG